MPTKEELEDHARQAWIQGINQEAFDLALALLPHDTEAAAEYLRQHAQRPEVLASLPFVYANAARDAVLINALNERKLKADAAIEILMRTVGIKNFEELNASDLPLAKWVIDKYAINGKDYLWQTFSRVKRRLGEAS